MIKTKKPENVMLAITIITVVCKVLGFLKNSVLAYYYGTSYVVDAYVMTFSIGAITSSWVAGLISNFTPKFKEIESNIGREKALVFSGKVLKFVLSLVFLLVIVLELLAPIVVKLVAPGFVGNVHLLTIRFFRYYCISILFYAVFRFSQEFLNCNQKHLEAISPDLLMSFLCIIAIVVSSIIGESYLIFGYIAAIVIQSVLTYSSSRRFGLTVRVCGFWDENLRRLMTMAIPVFLSDALSNINNLVDKIFASGLNMGTVASLDYANTMKDFAYQVGTIAIVTMMFPIISKLWAEGDICGFNNRIIKTLSIFSVLYIPLVVGIVCLGDMVIRIVFQRGAFTSKASIITTNAFIIYSINLIPMAYRLVFHKAFFAMQKTKYVLWVSFLNVFVNIILNIVLVSKYDYLGLVIATTIASIICMPFNFWLYSRTVGVIKIKPFLITVLKCFSASLGMLVVIISVRKGLSTVLAGGLMVDIIALCIISIIGAGVYFFICYIFKINEINDILLLVKRKKSYH